MYKRQLQGHLHVDLEFRSKDRAHLVAPSLGKSTPQSMKLIHVHADSLIVRTIRYGKSAGRFAMTDRRQEIAIPKPQRGKPAKPSEPGFTMHNYRCVSPHPHVDDPALAERKYELWNAIRATFGHDVLLWH